MDAMLKVLVLAALILLVSAQTFNNYNSLPDVLKRHIDKMLMKANQDFGRGHHIVFDSIISKPMTRQSNLYVNVLLKVTTCIKTSKNAYEHRDECDTRKDNTPLIDCLVCKTYNEKELVDCGRKINVSKGKRSEIRNSCRPYRTGASNLMALKSEDKRKIECLGCI
ncbi:cystatin-like protein [Silurus meridionalis]|uniref:cystatin-like protein n=1 Tax=Silurus meridionalis TaxID=175797 RepID=UPI001EEAA1A3|nr:cystatin-like protein [Silurus meridionalis]